MKNERFALGVMAKLEDWAVRDGLLIPNDDNFNPVRDFMLARFGWSISERTYEYPAEHDATLRALDGPHGYSIYKAMLARGSS